MRTATVALTLATLLLATGCRSVPDGKAPEIATSPEIATPPARSSSPASADEPNPFRTTFQNMEEAKQAMMSREPRAPKAGTVAPDFTLSDPDGKRTLTLSSFRGKAPVVLLFGSYT